METKLLRVEPINRLDDCDLEHDGIDVHASLADGRVYLFEIATPNCVYDWMATDGKSFFAGEPTLFVERLTLENISNAIQAVIDAGPEMVDKYGTLQTFLA